MGNNKSSKSKIPDVTLFKGQECDVNWHGKWRPGTIIGIDTKQNVKVQVHVNKMDRELTFTKREIKKRLAPRWHFVDEEEWNMEQEQTAKPSTPPQDDITSMEAVAAEVVDPSSISAKDEVVTANYVHYLDILDKSVAMEKYDPFSMTVSDLQSTPAPKGGWRWRPAAIEAEEDASGAVTVKFLDGLEGYPSSAEINLDDEDLHADYETKSRSGMFHHEYHVGDVVDILDRYRRKNRKGWGQKWRKCQIVRVEDYFIRVHFVGWSKAYDEWFHVLEQADRIAEFGSQTERELKKKETLDENFAKNLQYDRNLTVFSVDPDGNCLFRAVAHQVYGDVDKHEIVRSDCCDYLEKNRERFEFLVESGQFDQYVENKRKLRVWGDDAEVRAMEELYDRPVVVWQVSGDGTNTEPLKIHFDGDLPSEKEMGPYEPLRLSFHGNNHYNSVIPFVQDEEGKDISADSYKPPELRTNGVIRKHRRVKNKSKRFSSGFIVNTNASDDEDDEDEEKKESTK